MEISEYFCSQILCEINFDHVEGPKTAILTIWPAMNFEILGIFDIFKCKIPKKSKFKASKIVKMANQLQLISCKFRMAEKLLSFHFGISTVKNLNQATQDCIPEFLSKILFFKKNTLKKGLFLQPRSMKLKCLKSSNTL